MSAPATGDAAAGEALFAAYPALGSLPEPLRGDVLAQVSWHTFADGETVFAEGQHCGGMPLVVRGDVRVFRRSDTGREIVLYRVGPGETCVLTSSCLLGGADYSAAGAAEGALRLALLPPALFQRLIAESPEMRRFLFAVLSERLSALMERVERLAFHRIDRRIAEFLIERADAGLHNVAMTHQRIAEEIGSVREMVTRALGQLAEQGLVELSRAGVRLIDVPGLRALADGQAATTGPAGDKSR